MEEREELMQEWLGLISKVKQGVDAGDLVCIGMMAQATQNADSIIKKLPMPIQPEHAIHCLCSVMTWVQMETHKISGRNMDAFEFEVLLNLTAALVVERIRS